jgi:hypothetical protein
MQGKYLSILASLLYFVDASQPMTVTVFTFQKRLFLAYVSLGLRSRNHRITSASAI